MVDHQHWLDRWKEDRIGFHESSVNGHLQTWFTQLAPPAGSTVFVPLCGKAYDMVWIAQQGYKVIGIELSQIAIDAFFEENSIEYERSDGDRFAIYQSENICLLQGDFFDLRKDDVDACELVYDRAALIALESHHRPQYYNHMLSILSPGCNMLLITLEYDQQAMSGPPFSVGYEEVVWQYAYDHIIEFLADEEILEQEPKFRERGLTSLTERAYALTRYEPIYAAFLDLPQDF